MTTAFFKNLMLMTGLALTSFQVQAATATTTVSANIVPISSFVMSGSIVLGEKTNNYRQLTQIKANGASIETSSFNTENTAKLKINSSNNTLYEISISPASPVIDNASNKMEFKTLRTRNNFETLNNDKEQELVIEAVMQDNDTQDSGVYFGTVEINVNYN